ncbi:MAG: sporulation protein YunB [Christensenellaceae bacterium]
MRQKVKYKTLVILFVIVVAIVFQYKNSVRFLEKKATVDFQSVLTQSVYLTIEKNLEKDLVSQVVKLSYNSNGDIVFVSTDSFITGVLSYKISNDTLKYLNDYCNGGVSIPIGAFTGISLLSGYGKNVNMKIVSVSSVKCDFETKFESAGINQTRQIMFINVVPDITVVMPFYQKQTTCSISMLVYDNVIVGKVPEIYLNS